MTNFITQWNPPSPETETTGDEKFLEFFWKSRESRLENLYLWNSVIQETSEKSSDQESFINRILCHIVINRIPDEGLPDLIDSLKDVYQFHQNLAGSSHVRQLETTATIQAKIVSQYDRETVPYEES